MPKDTPRKKRIKGMGFTDIFFILVGAVIVIGLILGVLKIVSERFFSYYGGLGGTIIVYAVNTLEFCFLAWLLELIVVRFFGLNFLQIDWSLGLILGPVYATWCWVKKERNLGMAVFSHDWN